VIADWRGLPEKPFPTDTSKPIGTILDKVIAKLGLEKRLREEEVLQAWSDVVGAFIAQHSTPQRLVEGVLHVRVLQASMHYELDRTLRADILAKLKNRFGRTVRDIRFRVG
jgi:predicted nucleic acid-binding Zn ribbon protein